MQSSALYPVAVVERTAGDRRLKSPQPSQPSVVAHRRQRLLVQASLLRVAAPDER